MDIAYTFSEFSRSFCVHAMESMLSNRRTSAVCKVGVAGPPNVQGVVSWIWNQPSGWLQVEGAIRGRRPAGPPRPFAPATPFAPSHERAMGEVDAPIAPATPQLGCSQDSRLVEETLSASWVAFG